MITREAAIRVLRLHREELLHDFGVEKIALFGSVSRGEADHLSDVDVLVDIPGTISLFQLVGLRLRLQELLDGSKVDVVLRDSIFPPLRDRILAEALSVT